ncbi:MFS transporter [Streptomyces sp. SL13]|uniref:MFS transporter n=1 Tax=Streptantibioticus silvisoli TaxID=2705255 RepID=A0AA90K9E7_9ACTN|nr:MFS transporter [Streptantibioticus silvisoli]MDI5970812.1 MFS transporter [Streptantibioticus silvisoli]
MGTLQHMAAAVVPRKGHARHLAFVNLAYAVGRGVFLSGSIIYFTTVTGLTATQVGIGTSAAALSGFVASFLFGVLSDRLGAKRVLVLLFVLQAAGFALYPAVHAVAPFYALIVAVGFIEYGVGPTFGAFVGTLIEPDDRVQVRANLRSMFNIGFSLGSGLTALALLGGGTWVRALPWGAGVLLLGAGLLILRLPRGTGAVTAGRPRRFGALRDLRFVTITALSAPLALHASIILVALPLWAVTRTRTPHALIPLLLVANTVFVIVFQVAASRGAATVAGAARLAQRSGFWLAAACGAAAVAAYGDAVVAAAVLGVAMLLFTLSELQQSASGWGLAHGLAPEDAQGEYLGTFNLHIVAQGVLGPGVVSAVTISFGVWGWVGVAAVVVAAGLLIVPVAAAAERRAAVTLTGELV